MTDSAAEQGLFHDIYKELIEMNTTHSLGDNTEAARAMQARLLQAGFTADEVEVFEPFPRKGNLVARFEGSGKERPILLLAHTRASGAARGGGTDRANVAGGAGDTLSVPGDERYALVA